MTDHTDRTDNIHQEFLAEAQELIETLSRDLLLLDESHKTGQSDPSRINEIFRCVHTLKGIAGMFGYPAVSEVAHTLEDLLDGLRLGRVILTIEILDLLFDSVEHFQRLLAQQGQELSDRGQALEAYLARLKTSVGGGSADELNPLEVYELDSNVLAVLTEYEEHRLVRSIRDGLGLFRLKARFELSVIDEAIDDLKEVVRPSTEIITYLPTIDGNDPDAIELEVLMASSLSLEALRQHFQGKYGPIEAVSRQAELDTICPPVASSSVEMEHVSIVPSSDDRVSQSQAPVVGEAVPVGMTVANIVRVDIGKLDHLMSVVGELALVKSSIARIVDRLRLFPEHRQVASEIFRVNRGLECQLADLQTGILDVRMVPLGQVFNKLARGVRQVAREHNKQVCLVVTGAETEIDKLIVEELTDPLLHLIRNAIDHGLERPEERGLAGKSEEGTLALNAYQKGRNVVIEVEDDGVGMNPNLLTETAVRKGLLSSGLGRELTREQVLNLVFLPGFSTSGTVTDLSGRGVGMDVVRTNISRLGGMIDVQSEMGIGSKFTITLPITLAIVRALLIEVADRTFALPITSVQEALPFRPSDLRWVEGKPFVSMRGETLMVADLCNVLNLPDSELSSRFIVVTTMGSRRLGLIVDRLHGQQDVILKPFGRSLASVKWFAGATDLGDHRVALVIDASSILDDVLQVSERLMVEESKHE